LKNPELPKWLYRNYMLQHGGAWPFKNDGIAFVNLNDQVVVLEKRSILATRIFQKSLGQDLPRKPMAFHPG